MKRLLSVFLILVMILSLLPLGVYAEDGEGEPLPGEESTGCDVVHEALGDICDVCGAVKVSEANFPDEKFRDYITESISGASDVWLTKDELKAVTSIYADSRGISSLKGIEFFTSLEYLKCDNNSLTELDVSKNTKLESLECNENSLTELDLGKNTELEYLGCSTNALTALDLRNNSKLGMLSCSANSLRELDLSGCAELWALYCASNQLTSLDLSGCPAVRDLECGDNNLTSLDVSGCRNLWMLDCSLNQLTSLNVSGCKSLDDLDCSHNALTSLSLSDNTLLSKLYCSNNELESLDLSSNILLLKLFCSNNKLESLDLSKNVNLETLDCSYNYLTSLDLTKCKVGWLGAQYNIRTVIAEQNKFDLSTLPNFDVSKVVEVVGGTIEGNILTAEDEAVGYYYDCGLGAAVGFVLVIENFCEHDWTEASCTEAKTCSLCGASEGEALGHDLGEWEEVDEENMRRECSRCEYEEVWGIGMSIEVSSEALGGATVVWIDGVEYPVEYKEETGTVYLPENATVMTAHSFHSGDGADVHTQYPTSMKVWGLSYDGSAYSAEYIEEFDNLLQYSGSSIRIVGNKGIRMITSVNKAVKQALTGGGLAGYKLVEYGTVLAQTSKMEGGPLILGQSYSRSNYAYKKGIADPVFKDTGKLVQYTNVLVGFNNDQCKEDIAMRPYMILEDADGNKVTIYGGTIYRSIGYIAWQNRNAFQPKTAAYNYVWEIIHHVYGSKYDSEFKG